ncbi:MAG: hypothetical protein KQ78_02236 [Candidatus Izimaplasma bacterium HR2]|nr:MAG: hypothetical protein KQ78_02236 [Candidatus Izimaplasma bacterium HR2]
MNKTEYLLMCASEECGEIIQAIGKIGRFGGVNFHPKTDISNNEQLVLEVNDLLGILELLEENGVLLGGIGCRGDIDEKKHKVEQWMEYSRDNGILSE